MASRETETARGSSADGQCHADHHLLQEHLSEVLWLQPYLAVVLLRNLKTQGWDENKGQRVPEPPTVHRPMGSLARDSHKHRYGSKRPGMVLASDPCLLRLSHL